MRAEARLNEPLHAQAARAIRWTLVSAVVNKLILFGATVVLARLLTPGDFGAIAIITVAVGAGTLAQEFGTAAAVIYRREDEAETAGFVLAFQIASGVLLAAVALVAAPMVAVWFGEPVLAPGLRLATVTFLFNPFLSLAGARLEKALRYRPKFIVDTAGALAQHAVTLALAFLGFGVWSFVWGLIAGRLAGMLVGWSGWAVPISLRFPRTLARQTLRYSKFVFGEAFLWFVSANIDYVLVGRALGTAALGVYKVGFSTANLPATSVSPLTRVAFPAFARMRDDRTLLRASVLRATASCLVVGVPGVALMALLAEPLVLTLYGEAWLAAVPVVRILAPYSVLSLTSIVIADVMKAVDLVRPLFWINAGRVALLTVALLAVVPYGLPAVAATVLGVTLVVRGVQFAAVARATGVRPAEAAASFLPTFAATAVALGAVAASRALLGPLPPPVDLAAHGGLGVVVYLGSALALRGAGPLRELAELIGIGMAGRRA